MVRKKKLQPLADLESMTRLGQRFNRSSLPPPPVFPIVFPASILPSVSHQPSANKNRSAISTLLSELEATPSEAFPVSGLSYNG